MKRFNTQMIFVAGLLTLLCMPIAATDGVHNDLPDSLLECMDESDVLRRLSCYDQEMARLTSTTKQIPSAETEDPTTADRWGVTAGAPEEWPGKSDNIVQQEPQAGGTPQRADLTATIVKISKRPYGELIVSLDNGQVWAEKIPTRSMRFSVGDIITIRRGRFGGYRLSGRGNRSTEVTRVR